MKAIMGRKVGMSQVFTETGEAVAVTLVEATPNKVTLHRQADRDGYTATQLGLPKKNKPQQLARRREFKTDVDEKTTELTVTQFEPGDKIEVIGTSKGKGYAGVVKRHNFKGGPASHGHRHALRQAGSIGGAYPQHVFKGTRMAGRMGGERVTVKNLEIVAVDADKHLLAIKGAIPGKRGAVIEIRTMN